MADVGFTHSAVADLSEIDEYSLAQFVEEAGEAYMHGFDRAFALLRDHPYAGRGHTRIWQGLSLPRSSKTKDIVFFIPSKMTGS